MAMTTLTIDIDEEDLARLNEACAARGMTVQQMFGNIAKRIRMPTIFGKAAKKIRRKLYGPTTEEALEAFDALCEQGQNSPYAGMSIEDINAEIALVRAERKARERG